MRGSMVWLSYRSFRYTRTTSSCRVQQGSPHKAVQYSKDCISTITAFESQVETQNCTRLELCAEPIWHAGSVRNSTIRLLAHRHLRFIEGFWRIEKALMPKSGVRHLPGLPLLQRRERGGNHSSVHSM